MGNLQQDYIARQKISRECLFLAGSEVISGIALYLWGLKILPIPPFPDSRILEILGFGAILWGVYQLYWGGALWQQADDPEQWRQTASQMIGKYRSSPALLPVVAVGLVMLEWTLRGTAYMVFLLMELVPLELMLFPLLWEMRRL